MWVAYGAGLPEPLIDIIICRSLQGETFVLLSGAFEFTRSRGHGRAQAVSVAMQRLGLVSVIASHPCREWVRTVLRIGWVGQVGSRPASSRATPIRPGRPGI